MHLLGSCPRPAGPLQTKHPGVTPYVAIAFREIRNLSKPPRNSTKTSSTKPSVGLTSRPRSPPGPSSLSLISAGMCTRPFSKTGSQNVPRICHTFSRFQWSPLTNRLNAPRTSQLHPWGPMIVPSVLAIAPNHAPAFLTGPHLLPMAVFIRKQMTVSPNEANGTGHASRLYIPRGFAIASGWVRRSFRPPTLPSKP